MADTSPAASSTQSQTGTQLVKRGLAEMLKGGVIMDVVDPEQAKIAEDAAPRFSSRAIGDQILQIYASVVHEHST